MVDTLMAAPAPSPQFARPGCTLTVEPDLAIGKIRLIHGDAQFGQVFGIPAPAPRRQCRDGDMTYAWLAPGEWLVTGPAGAVAAIIAGAHDPLAFAIDISDGRTVFVLGGSAASDAICAVSALDVRDTAFRIDDVAQSLLGSASMFIARLPDTADGPQFRVIVDQTMAAYAARMLG